MISPLPFDNSYARLPDRFFARVDPAPSSKPSLIRVNRELAEELGLDPEWLGSPAGLEVLSGRAVAPGSEPIATAYAGHQFGNFVPQLGDGRAILLGEVIDCNGTRRDIQLKGGGITPFSRMGDGKAAIGPVLREYIVSEAMARLGIPTTRALAAVATGDRVYREEVLPGAVLTRVASSHIRVGTFQFFAARQDVDGLRLLADHVIARHYPAAALSPSPYRALLENVVASQASLIAKWMLVGFIHGVMNTDNMSIAGETIDYGPCAFMDVYDPAAVFSSIDTVGRYAYRNQPRIGLWNLTRLAEALLPLLDDNEETAIATAQEVLEQFGPQHLDAYHTGLLAKFGIDNPRKDDLDLANRFLFAMAENQVDFTLFFRRLGDAVSAGQADEGVRSLFVDPTVADGLLTEWRARMASELASPEALRDAMQRVNPAYIPRNHRVEAVIRAAVDDNDFAPFDELMSVLAAPFEEQDGRESYAAPPLENERVRATFCGT